MKISPSFCEVLILWAQESIMNIIPQGDRSAKAAHFFDHLDYFKVFTLFLAIPKQ